MERKKGKKQAQNGWKRGRPGPKKTAHISQGEKNTRQIWIVGVQSGGWGKKGTKSSVHGPKRVETELGIAKEKRKKFWGGCRHHREIRGVVCLRTWKRKWCNIG